MGRGRLLVWMAVGAGALALPGSAAADGWLYTLSNDPDRGKNTVLAVKYGNGGGITPAEIRAFSTRGTGIPFVLNRSVGAFAGDQQVTLSPDKRFLFAVNQGSNTVAVFRVNRRTGALRHVKGSPFRSGGKAPISVGMNGRHLVVVNHGVVTPFEPGPSADFGDPNFTSFSVSRSGRLRRVSTVPAGPGPTQAAIPADGDTVISTSFFAFADPSNLTMQSLSLSRTGRLREAPGSPFGFPSSMWEGSPPLPAFLPPGIERLAFGIATHPTRRLAYVLGPANFRVAVYRIGANSRMTFLGQADNPGGFAACWVVLTSDGRYMYTANSVTQDISLFRVSRSGTKLDFVEKVPLPSTGTAFTLAVDEDDRFLYALGNHADPDGPRPQEVNPDGTVGPPNPADGNFLEAYRIGRGGRIRSIGTVALPVRLSQIPYGLVAVERRR